MQIQFRMATNNYLWIGINSYLWREGEQQGRNPIFKECHLKN